MYLINPSNNFSLRLKDDNSIFQKNKINILKSINSTVHELEYQ